MVQSSHTLKINLFSARSPAQALIDQTDALLHVLEWLLEPLYHRVRIIQLPLQVHNAIA